MKYRRKNFLQLPREIFADEKFLGMSTAAKWLFVVLCELEHRYTNSRRDFFYRTNKELAQDTGLKLTVLKQAKQELSPYITTWRDGRKIAYRLKL